MGSNRISLYLTITVTVAVITLTSSCRRKAGNILADNCSDPLALNYVAGGEKTTWCTYAITNYIGAYIVKDTYIYADYYGSANDKWDTSYFVDTVNVMMKNGNTIFFDGMMQLQALDSSNATTDNTHYTDSLPYHHHSGASHDYGMGIIAYWECDARGVFRHDSVFFNHINTSSNALENRIHKGCGVKLK